MSDYALSEKATDAYNEDILSVLSLSDYPEQTHSQGSNIQNSFFIQVGIFSTNKTVEKLAKAIDSIGLQTRKIPITLNGQERIQLITNSFDDKAKAKIALAKIKEAKLPGIIKQQAN
jgi:hypothetical protein